jgi:hypothetical protein
MFTCEAILFMFSTEAAPGGLRRPAPSSSTATWVMILLMFSMAWRICFDPRPARARRRDLLRGAVHVGHVRSTSAEACDWFAVDEAICAMSWLERGPIR